MYDLAICGCGGSRSDQAYCKHDGFIGVRTMTDRIGTTGTASAQHDMYGLLQYMPYELCMMPM